MALYLSVFSFMKTSRGIPLRHTEHPMTSFQNFRITFLTSFSQKWHVKTFDSRRLRSIDDSIM